MRLRFGRWRGFLLTDVPAEYLHWLLTSANVREPLRTDVAHEIARRAREERQIATALVLQP
jgi:hypothetical protein